MIILLLYALVVAPFERSIVFAAGNAARITVREFSGRPDPSVLAENKEELHQIQTSIHALIPLKTKQCGQPDYKAGYIGMEFKNPSSNAFSSILAYNGEVVIIRGGNKVCAKDTGRGLEKLLLDITRKHSEIDPADLKTPENDLNGIPKSLPSALHS